MPTSSSMVGYKHTGNGMINILLIIQVDSAMTAGPLNSFNVIKKRYDCPLIFYKKV